MTIETGFEDYDTAAGRIRTYVARPRAAGRWPGLVAFSDIFQLTPSTCRAVDRLAGYGFATFAPEIYHRLEPPGTALPFDDGGRERGLTDAKRTPVADFDADARAMFGMLRADERVDATRLGAVGWCLGGHLAFRAAFLPGVRATVCFYPTGVHDGALGADANAGTLERAGEIGGALAIVFGARDPHVPADGRAAVASALALAGTNAVVESYDAEHAFMRDEGPRYDPNSPTAPTRGRRSSCGPRSRARSRSYFGAISFAIRSA